MLRSTRRVLARLAGGTLAAATVASLALPLPAAAAATPPPIVNVDQHACPHELVTSPSDQNGFKDLGSSPFTTDIECISDNQITAGKTPTRYSPAEYVSRAQMAVFFARIADASGVSLNTAGYGFTDIAPLGGAFTDAINALANMGVVQGTSTSPKRYSPAALVTRAQMASFINRLEKALNGKGFPAGQSFYSDVAASDVHAADINAITAAGLANGVGGGRYDPQGHVYRGQMAAFLARDLEANAEQRIFEPVYAGFPSIDVTQTDTATAGTTGPATAVTHTYSATVPVSDTSTAVQVTLLPSSNVIKDANGFYTMADKNHDLSADDPGANGCATLLPEGAGTPGPSQSYTPVNGQVSFTVVDSKGGCTLVPVVVLNENADDPHGSVALYDEGGDAAAPWAGHFGVGPAAAYPAVTPTSSPSP